MDYHTPHPTPPPPPNARDLKLYFYPGTAVKRGQIIKFVVITHLQFVKKQNYIQTKHGIFMIFMEMPLVLR